MSKDNIILGSETTINTGIVSTIKKKTYRTMTREEFLERIDEIMCRTSNAERACLKELYDEVIKPHWISVKVRKPKLKHSDDNMKCSDTVIVTNGEYRTSARWLYSTWGGWYGWYDGGDEELKGVTHWMPLPSIEHLKD